MLEVVGGARAYKVLMIFNEKKILYEWKMGKWMFEAGARASAGSAATTRVVRAKVNQSLSE